MVAGILAMHFRSKILINNSPPIPKSSNLNCASQTTSNPQHTHRRASQSTSLTPSHKTSWPIIRSAINNQAMPVSSLMSIKQLKAQIMENFKATRVPTSQRPRRTRMARVAITSKRSKIRRRQQKASLLFHERWIETPKSSGCLVEDMICWTTIRFPIATLCIHNFVTAWHAKGVSSHHDEGFSFRRRNACKVNRNGWVWGTYFYF